MDEEDKLRAKSGLSIEQRLADAERDGIDAELIFPNKGLLCWSTPDPVFQMAMCRAFNRWAYDHFGRLNPLALLGGATADEAIAEAQWAAERGFKGVALPAQPIFGLENAEKLHFNDRSYEPLWAALAEAGLALDTVGHWRRVASSASCWAPSPSTPAWTPTTPSSSR